MINVSSSQQGDFRIIRIEGRVDTTNYSVLEKEVQQVLDQGVHNIILNCKDLNYISSSGLRVFMIAQKQILKLNGKLYLCELQSEIYKIFEISGFLSIFKTFDTQLEALVN